MFAAVVSPSPGLAVNPGTGFPIDRYAQVGDGARRRGPLLKLDVQITISPATSTVLGLTNDDGAEAPGLSSLSSPDLWRHLSIRP